MNTILLMLLLLTMQEKKTFDDWKEEIARLESASNTQKVHGNANGTVDCGKYQINSKHFRWQSKDPIAQECNVIFKKYKVDKKLWVRVIRAISNDALNEDLARVVFKYQGIEAWTSMRVK